MRARRGFAGLPIFGTAAAGVVIGHWISYRLAVPDAHLRHHVLLASGHGHWLPLVKLAAAFALAGMVTLAARFASRTPPTAGADALTWAVSRLAIVQAVAFTGMEAVERLGSGAPVAGMFAHHLFLLGIAVQLLVACAGGAFLYWLSRDGPARRRGGPLAPPRAAAAPAFALAAPTSSRRPPGRPAGTPASAVPLPPSSHPPPPFPPAPARAIRAWRRSSIRAKERTPDANEEAAGERRRSRRALTAVLVILPAGVASAHEEREIGPYTVAVGFGDEPAYAGVRTASRCSSTRRPPTTP